MGTPELDVSYFYFDYSLIYTCQCGEKIKTHGTNHTNTFKCKCGIEYRVAPEVVRIK